MKKVEEGGLGRTTSAHRKGNVMEYFKPGEQTRMMYYSVMTQANSEKEILSAKGISFSEFACVINY